jgi:hypothetical protein
VATATRTRPAIPRRIVQGTKLRWLNGWMRVEGTIWRCPAGIRRPSDEHEPRGKMRQQIAGTIGAISDFRLSVAARTIIAESTAAGRSEGKVSAVSGIPNRARLYRVI